MSIPSKKVLTTVAYFDIIYLEIKKRPSSARLARPRTPPFHGVNTSSNLVRKTNYQKGEGGKVPDPTHGGGLVLLLLTIGISMSREARDFIEQDVPGGSPDYELYEQKFGIDRDRVDEILDDLEIHQCVTCSWWMHGGEIFLGHKDDCEHDELICGDCCND